MTTLKEAIEQYINKTAGYSGGAEFEEEVEGIFIEFVPLIIDGESKNCNFVLDLQVTGTHGTPSEPTYWDDNPGDPAEIDNIDITRIYDIAVVDKDGNIIQELVLTKEQEDKILADNKQTLERDSKVWRECDWWLEDFENEYEEYTPNEDEDFDRLHDLGLI